MHFNADLINGLYESLGGFFIALNCRRLYKDKVSKGVSWLPVAFYASWGGWNLAFYPSVNCWFSFWGGIGVVVTNTTWLCMMFYYAHKNKTSKDASFAGH